MKSEQIILWKKIGNPSPFSQSPRYSRRCWNTPESACDPVAQMDQSGRLLNGKSWFDSGQEHHFPLI
jgi:hypothetical protein